MTYTKPCTAGAECRWDGCSRDCTGQQHHLSLSGGLVPPLLRLFFFCRTPPHSLEGMFPITSSCQPAKQLFFQKGLGKRGCVNRALEPTPFPILVSAYSDQDVAGLVWETFAARGIASPEFVGCVDVHQHHLPSHWSHTGWHLPILAVNELSCSFITCRFVLCCRTKEISRWSFGARS